MDLTARLAKDLGRWRAVGRGRKRRGNRNNEIFEG
jgi:hypothetical protein